MLNDREKWKTLPGRKAESDNDVSIHINGLRIQITDNQVRFCLTLFLLYILLYLFAYNLFHSLFTLKWVPIWKSLKSRFNRVWACPRELGGEKKVESPSNIFIDKQFYYLKCPSSKSHSLYFIIFNLFLLSNSEAKWFSEFFNWPTAK